MRRELHLSLMLLFTVTSSARTHDSGFGHSRRAILVSATPGQLRIEYRVTQSPDEALIEMTRLDSDRDGKISPQEKDAYFTAQGQRLAENLLLKTSEDECVPVTFTGYELKHPLTQIFSFTAKSDAGALLLEDRNYAHKPGAIRIHAGDALKVELARPVDLNHAERLSLKITRK